MDLIRERTYAVRRRHQRQWMWQCCSWGLVIGGFAGCLFAAWRSAEPTEISWLAIAGAVFIGPLAGCMLSLIRPRALRAAAVSIDRNCGLKDRVTTALGFMENARCQSSPLHQLQIADAECHVAKVDPAKVAPIHTPGSWWWGISLSVAALAICILTAVPKQAIATVVGNDVVSAQAARMANELEQLKEFKDRETDPEVEKLLKELATKVEELKQPGVDPKEALAKLSEMETALEHQQQQLNEQNSEAALKEIGEALSLAEPLQAAGQAMSNGNMEKATKELKKAELPTLDRKTEKALTEKLDQQANRDPASGNPRSMRESTENVSQGITQGDRSKFKDGMQGLASETNKQGRRKKLSDLLRKQCQCLCECKGECECECKNESESNKKGGSKAGLARSGNESGDKTAKLKTGQEMKLTGQESNSGDSDVETQSAPEQEQNAVRQYRTQAKKYEQLAESALEAEPIPLGHRQTIRRYFELIRPQNSDVDAVNDHTKSN